MNISSEVGKPVIRYSENFKMAVVGEMEREGLTVRAMQRKYGIRGAGTVESWLARYGDGTRGKIIRVETPKDINETQRLKERVKRLEALLADTNLELALERQYTRLACQRAGIADVVEFKKKVGGPPLTGP
jgi:transposase-like protein